MKFLIQPLYNLYRNLLRDSRYRWVVVLGSLLYLVSPLDLVSDVLPVIGWIDDGLIATILVTEVSQFLLDQRQTRKQKGQKSTELTTEPEALTAG
jgi:uncharacterized membrane protein YkvA (DUF1232 family)